MKKQTNPSEEQLKKLKEKEALAQKFLDKIKAQEDKSTKPPPSVEEKSEKSTNSNDLPDINRIIGCGG